MALLQIENPYPYRTAFLQLGFRPFFTAALAYAAVSIAVWTGIYFLGWQLPGKDYPAVLWHAHEMVFGFCMAVVAGFLLTAVRNWTEVQTLNNRPLLLLLCLWLLPRFTAFLETPWSLWLTATLDTGFNFLLLFALLYPLVKKRLWAQVGIVSKLLIIALCNVAFYSSLLGITNLSARGAVYLGFYLILALILTMARRLIPFFIERAVTAPFQAKNYRWLDITSLVIFLVFTICVLSLPQHTLTASLALLQFVLHSIRLHNWHHRQIWQIPLLWILWLAYAWITLGFLLYALSVWAGISSHYATHSFAYGGMGLVTLGMMTRVSLGHTGRNVFRPPTMLTPIFVILSLGAVSRVLLTLFDPMHYAWWIALSQVLWISAFALTLLVYLPMLIRPRTDGRWG